jgi:sortase A
MSRVKATCVVGGATALLAVTDPAARVATRLPVDPPSIHHVVAAASPPRKVLGTLEVPRLGVTAVVRSGVDPTTLADAIGHVPETPRPGSRGNAVLAVHRDPFFGPLKAIRRGDRLRLRTPDGVREYRVSATRVASPDDPSMLEPTRTPALTLITYYPFDHAGPAPNRFVVRATTVTPPKVSTTVRKAPPRKKKKGFWGKLVGAFKADR